MDRRLRGGAAGVAGRGARSRAVPRRSRTGGGRRRCRAASAGGYRIGEAGDRYGQYFHYLTIWAFALGVLATTGRATATARSSWSGPCTPVRVLRPGYLVEDARGPAAGPSPASAWVRSTRSRHSWCIGLWTRGTGGSPRDRRGSRAGRGGAADLTVTQDLGLGMILVAAAAVPVRLGRRAPKPRARGARGHVGRPAEGGGYVCRQPGYHAGPVRLHQLRRRPRPAGGGGVARPGGCLADPGLPRLPLARPTTTGTRSPT